MMKVLVTGGAGFIGSHVADLYLRSGYEVVVVDDLSTGRRINLNAAAKFYELDIRSPELQRVFEIERPDYINHNAAQMDVRGSVVEPIFDADVNILGSINVMECARKYGVRRFVYTSTGGAVYGEPEYLPCDEDHPINPICPYGASKHTVEHYLFMYQQYYGLDYVVLRYPNVYGPRQDPHGEAGVVAIFTGNMLEGRQVVINGDGKQTRDYVYVEDCARASLMATTSDRFNTVYNLGSAQGTSVVEIFSLLKDITGYSLQPVNGEPKIGETRHIYLDAEKARRDLEWQPAISLDAGLERTVDYFRMENQILRSTSPVGLEASGKTTASEGGGVATGHMA